MAYSYASQMWIQKITVLMIENKHNTIPNIQTPVNYGNLENQQQLASK